MVNNRLNYRLQIQTATSRSEPHTTPLYMLPVGILHPGLRGLRLLQLPAPWPKEIVPAGAAARLVTIAQRFW